MSLESKWLIAAVVFVVIEIIPPATHFAALALSVGALAAAIAATFSTISWLPWAVFAVVSVVLMPIFIPLAKFLFSKNHEIPVGPAAGERALVIETIAAGAPGVVKINKDEWRARSAGDETLEKDQWVEIDRVEGMDVIVRKIPT